MKKQSRRATVESMVRFASTSRMTKPEIAIVFKLYCVMELSAEQIAIRYECTKSAVIRRLKKIHQITGMKGMQLRRYSIHLQRIGDELDAWNGGKGVSRLIQ